MIFPEAFFCKSQEYRAGQKERKDEIALQKGDLYSVMFALPKNEFSREAAQLPARVEKLDLTNYAGVYAVRLAMLDPDLKPIVSTEAKFRDGFWIDVDDCLNIIDNENDKQRYTPEEAYIKDYGDFIDSTMQEFSAQQGIKDTLLPPVFH